LRLAEDLPNRSGLHNFVKRHPLLVLSSIIVSISVLLYIFVLLRHGLLPGIDGPYYAVQVESIARGAGLKYPDPPLIFYFMYLLYRASGNVFLGVALGVSVFVCLTSATLGYLVFKLTHSLIASATSMIVFIVAPFEFRLAGDFMKNAAGLLWVVLFLITACKGIKSRGRGRALYTLISFALMLGAGLTHILDYGFILLLALLIPAVQAVVRRGDSSTIFYEALMAALLSLVIFYALPSLQGGDLFKALRITEGLLHHGTVAHPPKPVSSGKGFRPFPPGYNEIYFGLDCVSATLLLILSYIRRDALEIYASLGIATALVALPVWRMQVAGRLQLMGGVSLAISLGGVLDSVRGLEGRSLTALAVIGLVIPSGMLVAGGVGPSISVQAYHELNSAIHRLNQTYGEACLVVPDPPLRYWVGTIASNVQARIEDCVQPPIIVIMLRSHPPRIPLSTFSHLIYRGEYLEAWLIK